MEVELQAICVEGDVIRKIVDGTGGGVSRRVDHCRFHGRGLLDIPRIAARDGAQGGVSAAGIGAPPSNESSEAGAPEDIVIGG